MRLSMKKKVDEELSPNHGHGSWAKPDKLHTAKSAFRTQNFASPGAVHGILQGLNGFRVAEVTSNSAMQSAI